MLSSNKVDTQHSEIEYFKGIAFVTQLQYIFTQYVLNLNYLFTHLKFSVL